MTDAEIESAVAQFKRETALTSANSSDPATVGDVNKLIKATIKLFQQLAK